MGNRDPEPDWPCVQRKVPTISAGAVWSGPDPAGAGDCGKDFEAAALAQKLASRRTSPEEADQLVEAFAKATQDKAQRLTRVFAGVLELINTERDRVLHGIERYARASAASPTGSGRERPDQRRKTRPVRRPCGQPRAREPIRLGQTHLEERSQALTYVCERRSSSSNACSRSPANPGALAVTRLSRRQALAGGGMTALAGAAMGATPDAIANLPAGTDDDHGRRRARPRPAAEVLALHGLHPRRAFAPAGNAPDAELSGRRPEPRTGVRTRPLPPRSHRGQTQQRADLVRFGRFSASPTSASSS